MSELSYLFARWSTGLQGREGPGYREQSAQADHPEERPSEFCAESSSSPGLPAQPDDEGADLGVDRWPAGVASPLVGPLPADELPVPAEDSLGPYDERRPLASGHRLARRRQQEPVETAKTGALHLALQHPHLVSKPQELDLPSLICTASSVHTPSTTTGPGRIRASGFSRRIPDWTLRRFPGRRCDAAMSWADSSTSTSERGVIRVDVLEPVRVL